MSEKTVPDTEPALWLDDQPVTTAEVMAVLRKEGKLPEMVQFLVLERTLREVELTPEKESELEQTFRKQQNLESEENFKVYLEKMHITKTLLLEKLSRPERVVKYREERWGPMANSLYLKNKEKYDLINYRRLQSSNPDVMQEVFFRLKDKEESWETIAQQFPEAPKDADARQTAIPASQIEAPLLAALRRAGPGVVLRPLQIDATTVVVTELESIETNSFDELQNLIIREEFESWMQSECNRMLNKLQVLP